MLDLGSSGIGGMFFSDDAITKAYVGEDLVFSSEPPDPTLIAYWSGMDSAVGSNWVDRIGSKRWNFYNGYTKGSNYFELDRISNVYRYATLTDNDFGVDYEIKFVVDFELKPDGTNNMIIMDMGGLGVTPAGHWGMYPQYKADNTWTFSVKYNGNNSQTTTSSGTFPVLDAEVWTPCTIEFGIEHNESTDKQRAYMKVGEGLITSDWLDKKKIADFIAAGNKATLASSCYQPSGTTYSRTRIRFKTIKVYNVANQSSGGGDTPSTLPYDAEIEYLQSSGTQYIDTGINGQSVTRFVIQGYCYVNGSNNTQLLGGTEQSTSTFFGARVISNSSNWYCYDGSNSLGNPEHNSIIDATINSVSSQTGTLTDLTNNTSYQFTSFNYASWAFSNSNLLIFGGYSSRRSPNARCYALKIYTSSGLVRDFIPVRVGQVGYMYDKVSGTLLDNGGSGSFTLGNDKS